MAKTISKTFRLPVEMAKTIEQEAHGRHVSQGQYLVALFTENKLLKMKEAYMADLERVASDKAYLQEQHELAEADFL